MYTATILKAVICTANSQSEEDISLEFLNWCSICIDTLLRMFERTLSQGVRSNNANALIITHSLGEIFIFPRNIVPRLGVSQCLFDPSYYRRATDDGPREGMG